MTLDPPTKRPEARNRRYLRRALGRGPELDPYDACPRPRELPADVSESAVRVDHLEAGHVPGRSDHLTVESARDLAVRL